MAYRRENITTSLYGLVTATPVLTTAALINPSSYEPHLSVLHPPPPTSSPNSHLILHNGSIQCQPRHRGSSRSHSHHVQHNHHHGYQPSGSGSGSHTRGEPVAIGGVRSDHRADSMSSSSSYHPQNSKNSYHHHHHSTSYHRKRKSSVP